MSTELIVPTLGESITEATVSKWLKNIGDNFEADEPLVEIETDKITVEVPAPHAGSLKEIKVSEGTDVEIGGILGILDESKGKTPSPKKTENKEEKIIRTEVPSSILSIKPPFKVKIFLHIIKAKYLSVGRNQLISK